jgi:hypothetical protein
LEKAKRPLPAIECCRLYANQPAEQPGVLAFQVYYLDPALGLFARPGQETAGWEGVPWQVAFNATDGERPALEGSHWSALFDVGQGAGRAGVLDQIVQWFDAAERDAADAFRKHHSLPEGAEQDFTVPPVPVRSRLKFTAWVVWRLYRIRLEAPLLNGSYSFTRGKFDGNLRL